MQSTFTILALGLVVSGSIPIFPTAHIQASTLELIESTTVEDQALTFATGPSTRFSNTANGRTHQQTPLTTYRSYQYVTYFDAERRVCIGRRKIPNGSWDVIQFKDHLFESTDSHNSAVIGICDKDGTIHMAFDHHASRLNYRVSKRGAAHHPDGVKWDIDLFGGVSHTLGSVVPNDQVTYPRFFSAPSGNLMLYYRAVTSGNGDGMIEEYDGDKHDWTPGLGRFIARDIGAFTANDKTSLYRCPYMDALSYSGQRLHASWVWRDRFEKTNPANQHDLCYAYSDDDGRTWNNSDGKIVGKTGKKAIHLDSPDLVVAPVPPESGLTNQNTHYAYSSGSIHIVLRHHVDNWTSRYHHYWRNSKGSWNHEVLPFTGTRPKLVGSPDGTLVLVFTDDEQLFVAEGTPNPSQTCWQWTNVSLPRRHSILGEAVLDLQRWEQEKVLSIYSQEEPSKEVQTLLHEPTAGAPSRLNVVDYRLTKSGTVVGNSDFVSLFDEESLDGWIGDKPFWSVRDGALIGETTADTLITKNRFLIYEGVIPADFEFVAEYRISPNGNSGINYRSERVEGIDFTALRGYQCDIDGQNRYTGSNYEERGRTTLASIGESVTLPPTKVTNNSQLIERNQWTAGVCKRLNAPREQLINSIKSGEWNEVRIVAYGNLLEHYVNGQLMSKVADEDEANRRLDGQLGIQVHVGPPMTIEYRKLRVRPLHPNVD